MRVHVHGPEGQAQDRQELERELKRWRMRKNWGQTAINERPHSKAPSRVPPFHFLLGPLEPLNSFTSYGVTLINGCLCSFRRLSFYGTIVTAWLVSTAAELSTIYTWGGTSQLQGHPRLSPPWVILAVANSIILSSRGRREMWWK